MADFLTPADLEPLTLDPAFTGLKPDDRARVLNGALREAHAYVGQNVGWTPERHKDFGDLASGLRETALRKSVGEHVMNAARTIGGVVADSAKAGVAAAVGSGADSIPAVRIYEAVQGEGAGGKGTVASALATNLHKLGKSVQKVYSTADEPLDNELTILKQSIDAGEVPTNAQEMHDWLDQRQDRMKRAQLHTYTKLDGDTPENRAYAESNSLLGNKQHLALLSDYLQTRDPEVWNQLRQSLQTGPTVAGLNAKQKKLANESVAGRALNAMMGEGGGQYLMEATDPFEVAGMLVPMLKGAKAVKALKEGSKLRAGGELVAGAAVETASELGSQFMDDPGASWQQRLQVAKDAFIGSLGLAGIGGGVQLVKDQIKPEEVVAAEAAAPAATAADPGVARRPSDDLPPQRWTAAGKTFHNMPAGAEFVYDAQGKLDGWQVPKTALDEDLVTSIGALSPELRSKSENILAKNVPDTVAFLDAYRAKHGNIIDADQMREMLRTDDVNDADFTVATDPLVAALSREATRQAFDALPEGGAVTFIAGGPASGKSHALQQMPEIARNADVVIDAPMATYENAKKAVAQGLAKGAKVAVNYIHTPLEKATAFMMDRYEKSGRETNADKLADMHYRAQQTVMRLAREFESHPNFQARVIDNSGSVAKVIKPGALAGRAYRSLDDAKARVHTQIDHELDRRKQNEFWTSERQAAVRGGVRRSDQRSNHSGAEQGTRPSAARSPSLQSQGLNAAGDSGLNSGEGVIDGGGPGASSINEWKKTTFGQRLKSDERLREAWRQSIGGNYRVESEAEWQQRANDFIDQQGPEGAFALMTDPDSGLSDSDRMAIGAQLILHLDESIRQTELAGGGDISLLDDLLHETAEWVETRGTEMGQGIRVLGMWTRMSAEGVLRGFERKVNDARQKKMEQTLGKDPSEIADEVSATAAEELDDVTAEALDETTADQLAELQRQVAELRQQLAQATQEASAAQQEATQASTPADAAQAQKRAQAAEKRRKRAQRDLASAEARQQRKAAAAGKPRTPSQKKPRRLNPQELAARLIARLEERQAVSPNGQPVGQATKNQVQKHADDYTAGRIDAPAFQAALQTLGIDPTQAARLQELLDNDRAIAAAKSQQTALDRQAAALSRQAWDQIDRLTVRHSGGGLPGTPQRVAALSQLIRDYVKAKPDALPDFNTLARQIGLDPAEAVELQRLLDVERKALAVLAQENAINRLVDQLTPKLSKVVRERMPRFLQKLFDAHELGALDRPDFLQAWAEAFDLPLMDATTRQKVKQLIEAQKAAPDGFLKQQATTELMGELAKFKGISALDIGMAFWYANLLSGLGTQLVNLWGNAWNLMLRVLTVGASHNRRETLRFFEGMFEGAKHSLPVAKAAVMEGSVPYRGDLSFTSAHVLELVHSDNPATWTDRFVNGIALGRFVFRVLSAGDAIFYHTNREATAYLEAARYASSQQKTNGGAFSDYLAEQLGNGPGKFQQAVDQAKAELAGTRHAGSIGHIDRRAWEILEQQRPLELLEVSERFGQLGTFTQEPEGTFGQVAFLTKALVAAFTVETRLGDFRPLQFVIPFVNIICNMTSRSLDLTPIGIIRGAIGHPLVMKKGTKGKQTYDKYLPQEAKDKLVNGILGTVLGGFVMGLGLMFKDRDDDEVPFMIYGMGPPDRNKRQQMPGGWKPYTIKIGDRYWSYSETPFAYLFAVIGSTMDYMRYDKNPDTTHAQELLAYALRSVPEVTTKTGAFSGINELIKMMRGEATLQDTVARPVSGFVPAQGLLRDLNKLFGTPKLEATSIMGAVLKDVPVIGGLTNRPALNIFGEPVPMGVTDRIPGLSRITGAQKQDPEILWLMRHKLWIPGMNNQVAVGTYLTEQLKARTSGAGWREDRIRTLGRGAANVLTVEERYKLVDVAGPGLREAVRKVEKIKAAFPEMKQDQMQERLNAFVVAARRKAMMKVLELD